MSNNYNSIKSKFMNLDNTRVIWYYIDKFFLRKEKIKNFENIDLYYESDDSTIGDVLLDDYKKSYNTTKHYSDDFIKINSLQEYIKLLYKRTTPISDQNKINKASTTNTEDKNVSVEDFIINEGYPKLGDDNLMNEITTSKSWISKLKSFFKKAESKTPLVNKKAGVFESNSFYESIEYGYDYEYSIIFSGQGYLNKNSESENYILVNEEFSTGKVDATTKKIPKYFTINTSSPDSDYKTKIRFNKIKELIDLIKTGKKGDNAINNINISLRWNDGNIYKFDVISSGIRTIKNTNTASDNSSVEMELDIYTINVSTPYGIVSLRFCQTGDNTIKWWIIPLSNSNINDDINITVINDIIKTELPHIDEMVFLDIDNIMNLGSGNIEDEKYLNLIKQKLSSSTGITLDDKNYDGKVKIIDALYIDNLLSAENLDSIDLSQYNNDKDLFIETSEFNDIEGGKEKLNNYLSEDNDLLMFLYKNYFNE